MWHVCALGWMAPCLSYDVPTRCPSYFWWIMMIQTARIWSDPTAHALRTRHEQSPAWKWANQTSTSRCHPRSPLSDLWHTLHQRHVTTLPHIHFGPSFDPSSHSTDGYSQTCMYLEMLNCIPLYTPRISTSFVGFYMFLQFYMFTWFRPFFHCSTSTASGVDSVPRIFSSWEVNTWWRDMHSDWIWLAQEALRGSLPQTSRPLEWRQCQTSEDAPRNCHFFKVRALYKRCAKFLWYCSKQFGLYLWCTPWRTNEVSFAHASKWDADALMQVPSDP